jgi:hypothetical protein
MAEISDSHDEVVIIEYGGICLKMRAVYNTRGCMEISAKAGDLNDEG